MKSKKLTCFKSYLTAFLVCSVLNFGNADAQSIDEPFLKGRLCDRPNIECGDPVIGEWTYAVSPGGNSIPLPSTIEKLISDIESRFSGQDCSPKPTATFQGEFLGQNTMNIGTGNNLPSGVSFGSADSFSWKLSVYSGEYLIYKTPDIESNPIKYDAYAAGKCSRPVTGYHGVRRGREITCPSSHPHQGHFEGARTQEDAARGLAVCYRFIPVETDTGPCIGNPCRISTGAKLQFETDFSIAGLAFTRTYNSRAIKKTALGRGWHMNVTKRISYHSRSGSSGRIFYLARGDGTSIRLRLNLSTGKWQIESGSKKSFNLSVEETSTGFLVRDGNGGYEEYDAIDGKLLTEHDRNGLIRSYEYNSDNQFLAMIRMARLNQLLIPQETYFVMSTMLMKILLQWSTQIPTQTLWIIPNASTTTRMQTFQII